MELPEGFTRNPGERRVPDCIDSATWVTIIYRDGTEVCHRGFTDPALWKFSAFTPMLDIIGYKIEDDSACD